MSHRNVRHACSQTFRCKFGGRRVTWAWPVTAAMSYVEASDRTSIDLAKECGSCSSDTGALRWVSVRRQQRFVATAEAVLGRTAARSICPVGAALSRCCHTLTHTDLLAHRLRKPKRTSILKMAQLLERLRLCCATRCPQFCLHRSHHRSRLQTLGALARFFTLHPSLFCLPVLFMAPRRPLLASGLL